jgi:outer membrane protein assembly factor BamB/tetratricopeptide (TPR) repeat protein
LAVAVLIAASVAQHVSAQVKARRPPRGGAVPAGPGGPAATTPPVPKGYDLGSLTLPKDDRLAERIEAAADNIKSAQSPRLAPTEQDRDRFWGRATDTLQALMGLMSDVFVPVTRTGPRGSTTSYVSVKREAARMLHDLPPAGRDFYQAKYGQKATDLVKQAEGNDDPGLMAQAASLYLYTKAGARACAWLGSYSLDVGEYQGAARYYALLLNRGDTKELSDKVLAKALYAFHLAGDEPGKTLVFKELEKRKILKFREDELAATDFKAEVDKLVVRASVTSASDSTLYRSRPNRNARLAGGVPFMEPAWRRALAVEDKKAGVANTVALTHLRQAEMALQSRNAPLLTSFFPVTATVTRNNKQLSLLIYRSYWGIHAVDMKTGNDAWKSASDWSLQSILDASPRDRDSQKIQAYTSWLGHFVSSTGPARPSILFENSTLGTLSADNRFVYLVEDLAVPPPQFVTTHDPRFGGASYNYGPSVTGAIHHNRLQAFELATGGKLKWELGGSSDDKENHNQLKDTFFLGPPLPLAGKLYALTEKQQEIRLVTINPATGKVMAQQQLANTKDLKLAQDPLRRVQACHLSFGEGILVVPTNAGAVFGIDLLNNSLAWAYPYREKGSEEAPPNIPRHVQPPPNWVRLPDGRLVKSMPVESHWQVTAPIIQDGRVVFTAPDAKGLHCVNLRDGSPVWSLPRRDDDLYLAGVYSGKVVIVGKSRTRAVSLRRGNMLWELETGLPSGQGAASALTPGLGGDTIYYLPVKEAVNTREPEICAINVDRGIIHAHTRSRKKEVPGNLIFYEGSVLSQTQTEVVAYPQLEVKLAQMNKVVTDKPNDPVALTERGDYLLDKGDLAGAIADFRKALKNDPPRDTKAKARAKLYEAMTELFQRDFAKAESLIKEYEELCKVDLTSTTGAERTALMAEERRRRANFLCLVGKGREAQNRLVEAFERYLELGQEARKDELIQVIDEPSVKAAPDVWSQGRIAAMIANSKDPNQKKAVEDLITARWKKLKASRASLDELRKFVQMFGSLFGVGKEARLALAERLMEDTDLNSLLEAEQQLHLLRAATEEQAVAARAVEALARLNTRKGLLEDAAYYYRLLGEKFPNVKVDGKTGADYLDDLATDKRFLPYLDQVSRFVIRGKATINVKETRSNSSPYNLTYFLGHDGENLPFFARNRIGLKPDSHHLRMVDRGTAEERWTRELKPRTQFQTIASNNGAPWRARFSYQTLGHLVVVQLGHMVFGIDPLNSGRELWSKNLSSLPNTNFPPAPTSSSFDPRDGSVVVLYQDQWMQRLGSTGPLQGGVICLQKRDSLEAIDPVSGRVLWTRSDINSRSHVFGDEQYIYVVGMGAGNSATATRAFRAYDGVTVRVPEFANAYQNRVRLVGRNILVRDTDAKGQMTLRIYDVLQGKDLWKQAFPAGAMLMDSEDPRLAGVALPSGEVKVIDLATQKMVIDAKLDDPAHLDKAQSVALVADRDYVYVAINGPPDPNMVPWGGGVQPNIYTNYGMRALPVNGEVYSFKRSTGKRWWHVNMPSQFMILNQFQDSPVLLFTSRYQKWVGPPAARSQVQVYVAKAVVKHNGKMAYDNESLPYGMNFHELSVDNRTGQVDFTGGQMKLTFSVEYAKK